MLLLFRKARKLKFKEIHFHSKIENHNAIYKNILNNIGYRNENCSCKLAVTDFSWLMAQYLFIYLCN